MSARSQELVRTSNPHFVTNSTIFGVVAAGALIAVVLGVALVAFVNGVAS
jgi:hypothetical protein